MAPLPLQNPDVTKNRGGGICHFLNLQEDNVRFILLAVFLYVYLFIGAFMFQALEENGENKIRRDFQTLYDEFIRNFTNCYYPSPSTHIPSEVLKNKKFNFASVVGDLSNAPIPSSTSAQDKIDEVEIQRSERAGLGEDISRESRKATEPYRVTLDGLHELLFAYGNATQAGMVWKRKRWDWVGRSLRILF